MAAKKTVQRVNVDFPIDLLRLIDAEADRIGIPRQAYIKYTIAKSLPSMSVDRVIAIGKGAK